MEKRVYVYDDQQQDWVLQAAQVERYVYDGWNMIELLETTSNTLELQFCWGLDVSGSLHGAGGVGGLLAHRYVVPVGDDDNFWHFYDGNGNLTESVFASPSPSGPTPLVGWYVYGPYGQIVAQMDYARDHQFRFSTKWLEDDLAAAGQGGVMDDTGLYYYGHRFYSAETGRWLSRDPIGERGGFNLYAFVNNRPIDLIDYLGNSIHGPYRDYTQNNYSYYLIYKDAWTIFGFAFTEEKFVGKIFFRTDSSLEKALAYRMSQRANNQGNMQNIGQTAALAATGAEVALRMISSPADDIASVIEFVNDPNCINFTGILPLIPGSIKKLKPEEIKHLKAVTDKETAKHIVDH